MRVFVDTNVLFSASLFPSGVAARAYDRAVAAPNDAIVSDYVVDELRSVYARKFPRRQATLDAFLAGMASAVEIVLTPDEDLDGESEVRDPKDRPVLRAAVSAGADVLLTGDKYLLESGVEPPRIMAPGEFLAM
ncbi:MAG: putative toxin-antitoxin system toxin component, PIN family [Olsenella sp.]|nr:putative toxin-antitoxin system toxin component, PIN family [Olsenella sp.]